MSTPGLVGRVIDDHGTFEAIRVSYDCYPEGTGKALWEMVHGHFAGKMDEMLSLLLEQHRAGWVAIVGTDWSLEPRCLFGDKNAIPLPRPYPPQCYCHGTMHYPPRPLYVSTDTHPYIWDAFVIDPKKRTLSWMTRAEDAERWVAIVVIDLDGDEPQWEYLGLSDEEREELCAENK